MQISGLSRSCSTNNGGRPCCWLLLATSASMLKVARSDAPLAAEIGSKAEPGRRVLLDAALRSALCTNRPCSRYSLTIPQNNHIAKTAAVE